MFWILYFQKLISSLSGARPCPGLRSELAPSNCARGSLKLCTWIATRLLVPRAVPTAITFIATIPKEEIKKELEMINLMHVSFIGGELLPVPCSCGFNRLVCTRSKALPAKEPWVGIAGVLMFEKLNLTVREKVCGEEVWWKV